MTAAVARPTVDLLTFGESMVSLRSAGPLSAGGALTMHVAGAESNVAVGSHGSGTVSAGPAWWARTRTASSSCANSAPRASRCSTARMAPGGRA